MMSVVDSVEGNLLRTLMEVILKKEHKLEISKTKTRNILQASRKHDYKIHKLLKQEKHYTHSRSEF